MTTCFRGVFKRSAAAAEMALKNAGYSVEINTSKPRKGAFVIKVEGADEPTVELLNLTRPFKKLRELDLQEALSEIL